MAQFSSKYQDITACMQFWSDFTHLLDYFRFGWRSLSIGFTGRTDRAISICWSSEGATTSLLYEIFLNTCLIDGSVSFCITCPWCCPLGHRTFNSMTVGDFSAVSGNPVQIVEYNLIVYCNSYSAVTLNKNNNRFEEKNSNFPVQTDL